MDSCFSSLVIKRLALSLLPTISLQVQLASVHCGVRMSSLDHLSMFKSLLAAGDWRAKVVIPCLVEIMLRTWTTIMRNPISKTRSMT